MVKKYSVSFSKEIHDLLAREPDFGQSPAFNACMKFIPSFLSLEHSDPKNHVVFWEHCSAYCLWKETKTQEPSRRFNKDSHFSDQSELLKALKIMLGTCHHMTAYVSLEVTCSPDWLRVDCSFYKKDERKNSPSYHVKANIDVTGTVAAIIITDGFTVDDLSHLSPQSEKGRSNYFKNTCQP